jgi:hypothetical protein
MTNIVFTAIGAEASAVVSGKLTSGMVGVPILFKLDSAWDGLNIVATFIGSGEKICVPLLSNREITVPWEVLVKPNNRLLIGLEGRSNGGTMVIPTVWANAAYVYEGAVADGTESNPPTPSVYDQILESIRAGMLKGEPGEAGFSPTIEVTKTDGGNRVVINDQNGSQEFTVKDGQKGDKGDPYKLTAEDAESITNILLETGEFSKLRQDVDGIIADMNYKAIDITGFSNNVGTQEMGKIVNSVTLTWSINKNPASQTLDGLALATDVRSVTEPDMKITENRTFTLKVTDERGATDTASTSISFLNGVYYGVMEDGAAINNAAVLGLTRKLQGSRGITFTANAGATQRIAFVIPSRYGTPTFKDAETGFQAGFYKASTFAFTNASGYTENYDVWLSTNAGLGSLTATVS